LDNGNSRVVVFDKTGSYKAQYQADVIKSAKDFEVLEKDKKIYVLSGGKVYEITLK
jgi:dihydrofolate reductase